MSRRSRIISECYSSGSEHEVLSSAFLSEMVNDFIEEEANQGSHRHSNSEADHAADKDVTSEQLVHDELHALLLQQESRRDYNERKLLKDVVRAKEQADRSSDLHQRCVMTSLRAMGYNAAICKSRWSESNNIVQGEYAYIDVVIEPAGQRFIIDTEFSNQFQIARPSEQYMRIFSRIPAVFVGTSEQLHKIIRVVSDAMKLSLEKQELMLPPWRKPDYLRAKWFSTYRRTTNASKQSDWKPGTPGPGVNPATRKPPPSKALAKLLTEAGLIRRPDQVAHQLVTVS